MSTIKVNSIEPANAGSEDYFLARAWVNFDGTGTVAIRADGNVSSITDNGVGLYTVNIATAISDANYSAALGAKNEGDDAANDSASLYSGHTQTTSAFMLRTARPAWVNVDLAVVNAIVCR